MTGLQLKTDVNTFLDLLEVDEYIHRDTVMVGGDTRRYILTIMRDKYNFKLDGIEFEIARNYADMTDTAQIAEFYAKFCNVLNTKFGFINLRITAKTV